MDKAIWLIVSKAIVFGVLWATLPYFWFVVASLVLYFFPLFRAWKYFDYYLLLLLLGVFVALDALAVVMAAEFFVLLAIRELVFVKRATAFTIFAYLLMFMVVEVFFSRVDGWWGVGIAQRLPIFLSVVIPIVFYICARGIRREFEDGEDAYQWKNRLAFPLLMLLSFVVWQVVLAAMFLPLGAYHQATLVFGASALLMDLYVSGMSGVFSRERLAWGSAAFILLSILVLGVGV